jgi:hypothetical protein
LAIFAKVNDPGTPYRLVSLRIDRDKIPVGGMAL